MQGDSSSQIVTRPPPSKVAYVRRVLAERGSFIGAAGDAFHATVQAIARTDPTVELVAKDMPYRQGGKPVTIAGWELRRIAGQGQ